MGQHGPTWAMSLKSVRMGHLGLKVGSVGKPVFYNVFWWFWGSIWPQHVPRLAQHGPTAVCRPPATPRILRCVVASEQKKCSVLQLCFTICLGHFVPT